MHIIHCEWRSNHSIVLAPSVAREVVSKWISESHICFQHQMDLKNGMQDFKKCKLDTKWFTRLIFPLILSSIPCSSRPWMQPTSQQFYIDCQPIKKSTKKYLMIIWFKTKKLVMLRKKTFLRKYECNIFSNGWKNVVHWLLMSIVQIYPRSDVFFGSIYMIGST